MTDGGASAGAQPRSWRSEWDPAVRAGEFGRTEDDTGEFPPVEEDEEPKHRVRSFFAELPVLILIAFVLALVLKTFLVQAFYIPSASMEPTLSDGDRVLVNKVVFDIRQPRRGEVVVFTEHATTPALEPERHPVRRFVESLASGLGFARPNERDFIKRIMGLPGETIEMRDGIVYANGEPVAEAPRDEGGYLSSRDYTDFGPIEIPEGHYFMMGDNRPNSQDSRSVGPISEDDIVGRAFVIIWPMGRLGTLPAPDYGAAAFAPQ